MRATIRIASLALFVGYLSLVPALTYSVTKDPWTLLSGWHPSDQVPRWWCFSYQHLVTGIETGVCMNVLEMFEMDEIQDMDSQ